MIKRYISIISALFLTLNASAQGAADALRFSQIRHEGTARSMAMGNAFTSLGGDIYSISLNPASSAIYKYSEFSFTPSFSSENIKSDYLGNNNRENWLRPGISSAGFATSLNIGSSIHGLRSVSFGIVINKLNNYNSRSYSAGTTNSSSWLGGLAEGLGGVFNGNLDITQTWNPFYDFPGASWKEILAWNSNLLDPLPDSDYDYIGATENIIGGQIVMAGAVNQEFYREQKGSMNELVFNSGINFADKLFIGANIGIQSIDYSDYQKYSETAVNPGLFDSGFSTFTHTYRQTSTGMGVNLKLGVIALPVGGLRLGAAVSTPTWFFINDTWDESINARYSDGYRSSILSPIGEYSYRVNTPFRWNLGASYVFGKFGIISVDYEGIDYSATKMLTETGHQSEFREENQYIANNFVKANILRLGGELRLADNVSLRGGYSRYDNPEKNIGYDVDYFSGGLGIRWKSSGFLDFAFQKRLSSSENFSLYNDYTNHAAPIGTLDMSGWKFLMTVGFRF